jgi:hypothetical protein
MAITLTSALTEVTREDLSRGARETLPEISPLYGKFSQSWMGVERNMGRPGTNASGSVYESTWVHQWTIKGGLGGAFKFTNPNPELARAVGLNSQAWERTATTADFPAASEYIHPKYANPFVGLREGRGTLVLPWQLLRDNKITNVLVNKVADMVEASAELQALSEAISFFSRNPSWGEIARSDVITAAGGVFPGATAVTFAGTASSAHLTISDWHSEDQLTKFRPGLSCDIYQVTWVNASTAAYIVQLHAAGYVVDQVDFINEKVTFVTKDGSNATVQPETAASTTANKAVHIVCLKDTTLFGVVTSPTTLTVLSTTIASTTFTQDNIDTAIDSGSNYEMWGPDGLTDFVKGNPATDSFYGIPLARMPHLTSLVTSNLGDFLTERELNKRFGWFMTRYGPKCFPDTALTTDGVLNGMIQSAFHMGGAAAAGGLPAVTTRPWIVRTQEGPADMLKTGWKAIEMSYRGRTIELYDDPMAMRSNFWAFKTRGDNFRRLMPPPIPDAQGKPRFRDVEFVQPVGGLRDIWGFARSSDGGLTDYLEAPYVITFQNFVMDPQAIRIRGITEATGVS